MTQRRFTLTELLVLIAIFGILISLIQPSINRILQTSRNIDCQNKLKHIGVAIHHYSEEYEGWLPVAARFGAGIVNGTMYWSFLLKDYLDLPFEHTEKIIAKGTLLECPNSSFNETDLAPKYGGYGYNYFYMGYTPKRPKKLNASTHPSNSILISDSYAIEDVDASTMPWKFGYIYPPHISIAPYRRHQGNYNITWLDAHVSEEIWEEISLGKNGDVNWFYKLVK